MIVTSHGHSDVGFVREKNEDSFLVDDHKGIYAVADGVGGLPFGALASKLAVQFFKSSIQDAEDCTTDHELRLLEHILKNEHQLEVERERIFNLISQWLEVERSREPFDILQLEYSTVITINQVNTLGLTAYRCKIFQTP